MCQRISAIPWPIFEQFSPLGSEIMWPEQDSFQFLISFSVLAPYCILWRSLRAKSDYFGPQPNPPQKFKPTMFYS